MTGDVSIIETHCVDYYFTAESPRTNDKGGCEGGRVDHEKRGACGDGTKAVQRGKLRMDVWGCKVKSVDVNEKKNFHLPPDGESTDQKRGYTRLFLPLALQAAHPRVSLQRKASNTFWQLYRL